MVEIRTIDVTAIYINQLMRILNILDTYYYHQQQSYVSSRRNCTEWIKPCINEYNQKRTHLLLYNIRHRRHTCGAVHAIDLTSTLHTSHNGLGERKKNI
jgi:hypothetical protein